MCKVADFGLARLIEDNEYTARQGKASVQVKSVVVCSKPGFGGPVFNLVFLPTGL